MLTDNIGTKCLDLDLYGRHVNFTFHGHDKFRTKFGAFCTIFIGIIVTSYALFSATALLKPQPAVPTHSKLLYKSFYEIVDSVGSVKERDGSYGRIETHEGSQIKPQKFFAFGLGYDSLVDKNVGTFIAFLKSTDNKGKTSKESLKVVPCEESEIYDKENVKRQIGESFKALYCIENYNEYSLQYPTQTGENTSIEITFEVCSGDNCEDLSKTGTKLA